MAEATCISISSYRGALTRGKRYDILERDHERAQIRVVGDNGRARWFPTACFDFSNHPLAMMHLYCVETPPEAQDPDDWNGWTEVTIKFSNGEFRWCIFITPQQLSQGIMTVPGTDVPWAYRNHHLIIMNEISDELIDAALREIDQQGDLIDCTKPLDPDEDADYEPY